MLTPRFIKLEKEYREHLELSRDNIRQKQETKLANELWFELFENCSPTLEEIDQYMSWVLVTTKAMGYIMIKAGLWNDAKEKDDRINN
jgi:hypothetical protein